jgi:cyclohexa-1,5-dienecarbonyl-CoA hydratase
VSPGATTTGKVSVDRRHDGRVLHLTLNAPKGNVLDSEMIAGLVAALRENAADTQLRAVVFEGAGKHFSFGASVEEHAAPRVAQMLSEFHGLFRTLGELAIPTCAVVRGQCLGGGLELAAYCTWVFAAQDARFGQPEIKLGVFPPMASVVLPWRIGGGAALDLCISGRSIGADEARRLGLATAVAEDPAAAFGALFHEELARLSASSVRFAERAARIGLAASLERDLPVLERLYLDELMKTADANEGIAAFLERREPVFTGAGSPRPA